MPLIRVMASVDNSAIGFYPVARSDKYQIGSPQFRKAEVKIGEMAEQIRQMVLGENK